MAVLLILQGQYNLNAVDLFVYLYHLVEKIFSNPQDQLFWDLYKVLSIHYRYDLMPKIVNECVWTV